MRRLLCLLLIAALAVPAQAGTGAFCAPILENQDPAVWLNLAPNGAELGYYDIADDGVFQSVDEVILHLGTSGDIEEGDLILSGSKAGTRVTDSHDALDAVTALKTTTNGDALEDLVHYTDVEPDGGDGAMGNGDGLYLDLDDDDLVSAGDIRLVNVGGSFGSTVTSSASDVGDVLLPSGVDFPGDFRLYDILADGQSDDDTVYLDLDNSLTADPGDIRWSAYRNEPKGAWIEHTDDDAVVAFSASGLANILTTGTTGPVILSSGTSPQIGDLSVASHSDCAFRKVLEATTDCAPSSGTYGDDSFSLTYLESGHHSGYDAQDTIYLHVGGGTTVQIGDVRLTSFLSKAAGTRVLSTDGDEGQTTTALGDLHLMDVDGNGLTTEVDGYYLDLDNDDYPTVGDLRLSKVGSLSAGQLVSTSHGDYTPLLQAIGGAAGTLAYIDDGESTGSFDIKDTVLLRATSGGANIDEGDVRISAGDGNAGTLVVNNDDEDGEPAVGAPALTFRYFDVDASSGYDAGDYVYVTAHAGPGHEVSTKDVRLTQVDGLAPGTRVVTTAQDARYDLEAFASQAVLFEDRDGDDEIGPNDVVYLNLDDETGNGLAINLASYLDIRLTGSGGTSKIGNPSASSSGTSGSSGGSSGSTSSATRTVTQTQTSGTATVTQTETVATVTVTADPTTTQSATETTSSTTGSQDAPVPGFGLVAAIAALGAVMALRRRL